MGIPPARSRSPCRPKRQPASNNVETERSSDNTPHAYLSSTTSLSCLKIESPADLATVWLVSGYHLATVRRLSGKRHPPDGRTPAAGAPPSARADRSATQCGPDLPP
eukprot:9497706-Pyramimonas_sp.AAC.1